MEIESLLGFPIDTEISIVLSILNIILTVDKNYSESMSTNTIKC